MTGGGDSHHFQDIDSHFIGLLSSAPKLLYFPFAQETKYWKDGHKRIAETFSSLDFDHIEMCQNLEDLEWDYLATFDAIYIDGGNTFKLMNHFRNNHGYELLRRFLFQGGVINGDSAGAICLGSHIATAHFGDIADENSAGLVSYQGLNTLGNWSIHCHYDEHEDLEIIDFVKTYGFPVLALHETTSISIENNHLTILGESPLTIFSPNDGVDIYLPGQSLSIEKW